MTVTTYDTQNPQGGESDVSPGRRLREARLAVNLEVEDVAARLRLDAATVRSLEEDRYDDLPAPTFVRGYLSSYSRLLDLPPGPVIEAFDRQGLTPPPLVPDIANKPQVRSSDLVVRMVTYLIAVGLFALVLVWWHSQEPAELADLSPAPTVSPMEDPSVGPAARLGAPSGAAGTTPTVSMDGKTDETAESKSASSPDTQADASTLSGEDAPAEGASVPPPPSVAETRAGGGQGEDVLKMRFPKESWVEVYDGNGERLFFGSAKEDSTVEVTGKAPLRVILGYAPGVQVEYNGKPFDQSAFIERKIARFTLGQPGTPETP